MYLLRKVSGNLGLKLLLELNQEILNFGHRDVDHRPSDILCLVGDGLLATGLVLVLLADLLAVLLDSADFNLALFEHTLNRVERCLHLLDESLLRDGGRRLWLLFPLALGHRLRFRGLTHLLECLEAGVDRKLGRLLQPVELLFQRLEVLVVGLRLRVLRLAAVEHFHVQFVYPVDLLHVLFAILLQLQIYLLEFIDLQFLLVDNEVVLSLFRADVQTESQRKLRLVRRHVRRYTSHKLLLLSGRYSLFLCLRLLRRNFGLGILGLLLRRLAVSWRRLLLLRLFVLQDELLFAVVRQLNWSCSRRLENFSIFSCVFSWRGFKLLLRIFLLYVALLPLIFLSLF